MSRALLKAALAGTLAGMTACGPKTALDRDRQVVRATEVVEDGGVSPFEARLAFKAPEAMAIQEAAYNPGKDAEIRLWNALKRYESQWTLTLTVGPRASVNPDPLNPLALDIENNGGVWHDRRRNLDRLMFEMKPFIVLKTRGGQDIEPILVEYQRSFGMGKDRSFLLVFPKGQQGKPVAPPFEVRVREFGQGLGLLRFEMKDAPGEMAWWRVKRLWKASAKAEGNA